MEDKQRSFRCESAILAGKWGFERSLLEIRTFLYGRGNLVDESTHLVSSIKGHLKVYGVKLGKDKSFREKVEQSILHLKKRVEKTLKALLNILDKLEQEIKSLDKEVIEAGNKDPDVQLLQSICEYDPFHLD